LNGKMKHFLWVSLGRPVMRMSFCVGIVIAWFSYLAPYIFLFFLPQFKYYETVFVSNPGTTDADVFFWWAWIPTLLILVLGIFWSSGLLGKLWEALN
jgi:hypothetical protein